MTQDEYLKERVDDQIAWYSSKSSQSQQRFKHWRLVEIAAAALIPFLIGYVSETGYGPAIKFTGGALGMLIAVISG